MDYSALFLGIGTMNMITGNAHEQGGTASAQTRDKLIPWTYLKCRLCWRITGAIFISIFIIEGLLLVPSYHNYERDLLVRLEENGHALFSTAFGLNPRLTEREFLGVIDTLTSFSSLRGAALYRKDGTLIGMSGETPQISPDTVLAGSPEKRFSQDRQRYDVTWRAGEGSLPITVIGRLDSVWVQAELNSFVWRIIGLVMVIALFVTIITMLVLGQSVFLPILVLRDKLQAASLDPDTLSDYSVKPKRNDEWGDVVTAFNNMLKKIALVQADLASAREKAEHANQSKSRYLSDMSHELRTPLNAILGFSQIIASSDEDPLSEDQKEHLGHILGAGNHMLKLINGVLDLSKVESGTLEVSIEDVELGQLVGEVSSMVKAQADARGIGIHENNLAGQNLFIRADYMKLEQVMLNLLSNAIKYNHEEGNVIICIERTGASEVRLSVIDTGQGIAPEELEGLFKPFNRLGQEDNDVEGTGLGLAITKGLVELMGGRIGVDSQPGTGSTFWVELPLSH